MATGPSAYQAPPPGPPIAILPNQGRSVQGQRSSGIGSRGWAVVALGVLVGGVLIAVVGGERAGGTAEVLGACVAVLAIVPLALVALPSRQEMRAETPDTILVYPDRVVGTYAMGRDGRAVGPPLTIPFRAVRRIVPGGSVDRRTYEPAQIIADYLRVETFDPASVGELVAGPPVPAGCARRFYLTPEVFQEVSRAFLATSRGLRRDEDGAITVPDGI